MRDSLTFLSKSTDTLHRNRFINSHMTHSIHNPLDTDADPKLATFPALATLRLTDAHLICLSRQGVVSAEQRGSRTIFKLRFREDNCHQVVRYIGSLDCAEAVKADLRQLQASRRLQLRLARVCRKARFKLREAKSALKPRLADLGLVYHGQAIRRPRQPKSSLT
jgi:hypothetical protein